MDSPLFFVFAETLVRTFQIGIGTALFVVAVAVVAALLKPHEIDDA